MIFLYFKIFYLFYIIIIIFLLINFKNIYNIRIYKSYINLCKKLIELYFREKKLLKSPYFSICISLYNMEKYIEASLLSVLNQSFRNFEIIIINDYSTDNSGKIIERFKNNDKIQIINHEKNLGVYKSRIDSVFNAKGKYIIFLDPDDLFSNHNLLKELYNFNLIYNLDIIEYSIILQIEKENKLYYPKDSHTNHFHFFNKKIISHPELSNILFFSNNKYTNIFCRCLWNKMVRKDILYKTINFLGEKVYNIDHFDFAEDTIINILNFQFASNYSNLNLYGYMYNVRSDSMSHSNEGQKEGQLKMANNIVYFYQLFYEYIKYFNKDINYLYYDLKYFDYYFKYIKDSNTSAFQKRQIKKLYSNIIEEKNISNKFREYAKQAIIEFI